MLRKSGLFGFVSRKGASVPMTDECAVGADSFQIFLRNFLLGFKFGCEAIPQNVVFAGLIDGTGVSLKLQSIWQ